MDFETLREALPDYAKDLKLNLGSLAAEQSLSEQQLCAIFLACAHAIGVSPVVRAINAEAQTRLSAEAIGAAKSAAAVMGMNNVYYRSVHLLSNKEYSMLRAGLRMNVLANPGIAKLDFELCEMAVSAINGCGACLDAHETHLRKLGASVQQIQAALKIGAVVAAISAVLRAEAA